jgi:hypothetical protein
MLVAEVSIMRRTKGLGVAALALLLLSGCASGPLDADEKKFEGTCMPGDANCPICWRREGYPATAFLTAPVLLPLAYAGVAVASPVALLDGGRTRAMGVGADVAELLGAPLAAPLYFLGRAIDAGLGMKPETPPPGQERKAPVLASTGRGG